MIAGSAAQLKQQVQLRKWKMISRDTDLAILDTINHPIIFVDTDHVIRYLNKPAMKRYYEVRGYSDLIGKSLFDCHNEDSRKHIIALYERLQAGENEIFLKIGKFSEKITVIAVRETDGTLLGYYERFEKNEGA
jgi:nitrogen-specific signal transduction histidine kinase